MSTCRKLSLLALMLALPLCAFALERKELLPPDAQGSIRITNTAGFWAKLKQSPIGRLWADPQFQDFIGHLDEETLRTALFGSEPSPEDKVFYDQVKMLTGEVLLAFRSETKDTPYIVAAITAADYERSLEMDYRLKEVAAQPCEIRKSSFQGVQVVDFTQDAGTPEESSWSQTFLKDTLLVGPSREWVERGIVRLRKEDITEPKGPPRLTLNLLLSKLIGDTLTEAAANTRPGEPDLQAVCAALGLTAIDRYTLDVELKEAEMTADSRLLVSDLTKGIFTLLDMQPVELPTVAFIPEEITTLEVGRFNLLRLWQEIPAMVKAAMPEAGPQIDLVLAMLRQQTGIDLEQDLLAHLDTRYVGYTAADGDRQLTVVAVSLKDELSFRKGLETALSAPALQPYVASALETADFIDRTLYTIKGDDPAEAMSFAVSGGYFLYGSSDGLRQVIRSQSSDAAANPAFERSALVRGLRQAVPPGACGFSAVDWKKEMEFIVGELATPEVIAQVNQQWRKAGKALPPPDFRRLPPAGHIASFFNVSYQYVEPVRDGIHQQIILKY